MCRCKQQADLVLNQTGHMDTHVSLCARMLSIDQLQLSLLHCWQSKQAPDITKLQRLVQAARGPQRWQSVRKSWRD